jgi:hypothetical protein
MNVSVRYIVWRGIFWIAVITVIAYVAHDPTGVGNMVGGLIVKGAGLIKGLITAVIALGSKIASGISGLLG